MNHYGIRGNANNLFASFLANRKQNVFLNHTQSNYRYIKCSVPQGSVLGPLLFTIYINGISSSANSAPRLYADDTCLILQDDSISNIKYKIKGEINAVNKWMIANKLTLNMSKSNVTIINSNKNGKSSKNCYNEVLPIMIVKNVRYLGVTFDEFLSFDCHIKNLIKRLSRSVGILAKVKPFLNTKALLNLYYSIFHSHLQYGLITWSSTFKSYLKKFSTLQNKAVKIVGGGKYYDRATQVYAKLRILKLVDMVFFEKALFVFKFKMKMLPDQFSNYLTKASPCIRKVYQSILPKQLFYSCFEYVKSSKIYKISRSSDLKRIGCRFKNIFQSKT